MPTTSILPTKEEFTTFHTAANWVHSLCHDNCDTCFIGARLNGEDCPVPSIASVDDTLMSDIINAALASRPTPKEIKQ